MFYLRWLIGTDQKDRALEIGSTYQDIFRSNPQWQQINEQLTQLLAPSAVVLPNTRNPYFSGHREKTSLTTILKEIRR